ncbi:hypothetical protein PsYK624_122570 [Phanerochaete sordida]|uniref:Alcohol dehydrogenase-like C-terminal domain-containing protein n=1 Tax=Phanerochaete sordida TaxID=48140 RepID=A0A9P3GMB3_9APHY|nr:hypothetical protein PsYK624_122570 [Phanerochaete sordida]
MVVGLPARASLNADIFFIVVKSISTLESYVGNRQDAREALDLAARGKVRCFFELKPLSALKDTYQNLEKGTVVGRVVLDMKNWAAARRRHCSPSSASILLSSSRASLASLFVFPSPTRSRGFFLD